jgi:transcription-repair coupling factor (superfamily II helicase)
VDTLIFKAGQVARLNGFTGSADAQQLAELALRGQRLAVFCAAPWDAQRLVDEIRWFAPGLQVRPFPDWEILPYDAFSPHPDLISERLATLYLLSQGQFDIALVPFTTALTRLPPPSYLVAHTFFLKQGTSLNEAAFRAQMALGGYQHVSQVYGPGEFSLRGGLIDLFPMGSPLPYRLDLFDAQIESIKAFDPDTQRSLYPVPEIRLLPAREYPLDEAGIARFRQNFRERFEGDPTRAKLYKDVSNGLAPSGIESWLPLFFDETAQFLDYLPAGTVLVSDGDLEATARAFHEETASRHRLLSGERDRPLLPPDALFLTAEAWFINAHAFPRLVLGRGADGPSRPLPALAVDRRASHPLGALQAFLDSHHGRTLVVATSAGRRETLQAFFGEHGLKPALLDGWSAFVDHDAPLALVHGPLAQGYQWREGNLAIITESELYALPPRRGRARPAAATQVDNLLRDLSELKPGDPVVHDQYGVGRYQGLVNLDLGDGNTEFLLLEYAGGDKLYVPVTQLGAISPYSGVAPDDAPLHKLGTEQWEKARRRAMQAVRDTAAELLALYAQRAARSGHAFTLSQQDYQAFAESFGFEETPDQAAAIAAVIQDMTSGRPMDRLVCGDVGFGKTEVALRAAFIAVMGGRQVAVLAPTTLLAEQHFLNFSDRFSPWPVKLAELSRFRSVKEQSVALAGLAQGQVDIVIGTHKLIQGDVHFANLGLVIIDEEHRFGVRQKERFKALRAEVDVLTLTATPIPRTLAMSLEGIRDFSVIATAPQKRLAVKTFVRPYSAGLIREAVLRELKRGGQVFFLHNEVESIEAMRDKLTELLPEARIGVGHGQMPERELEHVMRDFYQQRFNLLLCTTIIETGIDIPTANTILINRADRFGLAQLHQLRGRVGRSHHQAFAYLLIEDEVSLSVQAKKRLDAIQALEELGAGFHLAMHDLEIRGAGEVLGDKQSGEMQEVGFAVYNSLLTQAVESLRAGHEPDLARPLDVISEIRLHAPALLPADYCPDVHERLILYKRLANSKNAAALTTLSEELVDRFGDLPDPARVLLDTHRLRLEVQPVGIQLVDAGPEAIVFSFTAQPAIDPARLIRLIQTRRDLKLTSPTRLRWQVDSPTPSARVTHVRQLLKDLT